MCSVCVCARVYAQGQRKLAFINIILQKLKIKPRLPPNLCYVFLLLLTTGYDAILCSHVIVHHHEREISTEGMYCCYGIIWLLWCML